MAIKIPAGEAALYETQLNPIRVIKTLWEDHISNKGGLIDQVKQRMRDRGRRFAQSSFVTARLQPHGGGSRPINVGRVLELLRENRIALTDLLRCAAFSQEKLGEHLSGQQIDYLFPDVEEKTFALYTDFMPGVRIHDPTRMIAAIGDQFALENSAGPISRFEEKEI